MVDHLKVVKSEYGPRCSERLMKDHSNKAAPRVVMDLLISPKATFTPTGTHLGKETPTDNLIMIRTPLPLKFFGHLWWY